MDHLFPTYLTPRDGSTVALSALGIKQFPGVDMTGSERWESIAFNCSADTKIDAYGSEDGVTLDLSNTQAITASTGAMSAGTRQRVAGQNLIAPYVIFVFTDISGVGGTLSNVVVWTRENVASRA